jgi:uncharacterized membrane protein
LPSFARYLLSKESAPFLAILCWSIALILAVYIVAGFLPRLLLSVPYLVFSPGYSLISFLLNKKELDLAEELALSLGLSFCIVALLVLVLSLTPLGVNPVSVAASITAFTLTALFASTYRQYLRKAAR